MLSWGAIGSRLELLNVVTRASISSSSCSNQPTIQTSTAIFYLVASVEQPTRWITITVTLHISTLSLGSPLNWLLESVSVLFQQGTRGLVNFSIPRVSTAYSRWYCYCWFAGGAPMSRSTAARLTTTSIATLPNWTSKWLCLLRPRQNAWQSHCYFY